MIGESRGPRKWRHTVARLVGVPTAVVLCHAGRLSSKKLALALVYHSLADRDGDPATELVAPHGVASFRAHLRLARRCFKVIPASQLVPAMSRRRRGGRFPLAVTFDDDLSSHRIAASAMVELGLTATFFLTGATLDGPRGFWWQLLQACYDLGLGGPASAIVGVEDAGLHAVALTIQHMPRCDREGVTARLRELLAGGEPEASLQADDVRALVASRAEIGFHTLRHDYLPELPDDALEVAVSEGRDRLESAAGEPIRTIAYPHGGTDRRVAAAAGRAGFELGFAGEPSAIRLEDDPLLLARIEPPRAGAGRFGMRVARHLLEGLRT